MCCRSCFFPMKTFRITSKEVRIQYSSKLSSLYVAKQEMVDHKKPSVNFQGSKTQKILVLSSIKIVTVCICTQNLKKYLLNTNSYVFLHSFFVRLVYSILCQNSSGVVYQQELLQTLLVTAECMEEKVNLYGRRKQDWKELIAWRDKLFYVKNVSKALVKKYI